VALCRCHAAFSTFPDGYGLCDGTDARKAGSQLDERAALDSGRTETESGQDEKKAGGEYAGFELADYHAGVRWR